MDQIFFHTYLFLSAILLFYLITMKDYENWKITITDQVAKLIINNPTKMNAFSESMMHELAEILDHISNDSTIRALILTTSNDKMFSAGADMDWFIKLSGEKAEEVSRTIQCSWS